MPVISSTSLLLTFWSRALLLALVVASLGHLGVGHACDDDRASASHAGHNAELASDACPFEGMGQQTRSTLASTKTLDPAPKRYVSFAMIEPQFVAETLLLNVPPLPAVVMYSRRRLPPLATTPDILRV